MKSTLKMNTREITDVHILLLVILILIDISLCVTLKFFENVVWEKKMDISHIIGC